MQTSLAHQAGATPHTSRHLELVFLLSSATPAIAYTYCCILPTGELVLSYMNSYSYIPEMTITDTY